MSLPPKNAKISGCLVFCELDANAKLGNDFIPGDHHQISANGEYLKNIIESNNMILCNSEKECDGLYTRERKTVNNCEKSIIDYVLICQDLYFYFKKMKIDAVNSLRKYSKLGNKSVVTKSDHHLIICQFRKMISIGPEKNSNDRTTSFNFNDPEGWQKFKNLTSGNVLTKCIKGICIQEEGRIWLKNLKNILHRSFKVTRRLKREYFDIIHHIMIQQ